MRFKKIVCIGLMALLMVVSVAGTGFADEGNSSMQPYSMKAFNGNFEQASSTKGRLEFKYTSDGVADSIKAAYTLQEKSKSSNTWKNSDVKSGSKTVKNAKTLEVVHEFSISSTKDYRVYVEIVDIIKGDSSSYEKYLYL